MKNMSQIVQPQFHYEYEDEISLMDILLILKESWKLIAVIFLITVIVAGSVTYFFIPKKYRCYTLFTLEAEGMFATNFGQVQMVRDVILSNHFLKGILEKAGMETDQGKIDELRSALTISATEAKNIRMQIIWDDPETSYELLSLVKNTYHDQVAERIKVYTMNRLRVAEGNFNRNKEVFEQINKALVDFQKRNNLITLPQNLAISDQYYLDYKGQLTVSPESIAEYEKLVAEHAAAKVNYTKAYGILDDIRREVEIERNFTFVTIEPPAVPERKYSPSVVQNTAIAGVLALFVGVMLTFLREYVKHYQKREQSVKL